MNEQEWICCIDFGTALSKCAMVASVDRNNLSINQDFTHIVPLDAETGNYERTLRTLVGDAVTLATKLGSKLSAKGGLSLSSAASALRNLSATSSASDASIFALTAQGSATVLEATAVASSSIRATGRRVVAVADIGGGTCDFAAFITGFDEDDDVIGEVEGSSNILHDAGDYLDMQLRRLILLKAGVLEDSAAGRGIANRLRVNERRNKEDLFTDGQISIELNDGYLTISREEFLFDSHVVDFSSSLRNEFYKTLYTAVMCAQNWPQLDGSDTAVEILLTGGGHKLPMVQELFESPSVAWEYTTPAPDLIERPDDVFFSKAARQLVVAIGGAIRDLPILAPPITPF
ncbi:MAG: hypothetical protein WBX25_02180 [Rhodomicrobium sp.]